MNEKQQFDIIAETKDLTKILGFAGSVVEKRNILPILSHIKLEAFNNKLVVTATDMDLALCQNIGAEIKLEGAVTVHSQTFSDIVRKIHDKSLEMKYKEATSQLEIRTQNCEVTLSTLPASDFPAMDHFTPKFEFKVPAKIIVELIEYTKFAISTEETRYNLNGIYLHTIHSDGKKFLASAATDGHRLSTYTSKVNLQDDFSIILPRKTVGELHKILKDPQMITSDITIAIGHNRVRFTCNHLVVVSKLIDGSFPDYQVFIPASNNNKLTISSKLLTEVVDRVATVTADKFPAIKMTVMEDQLELNAHGEAKGLAHELIPINGKDIEYSGNQITIGFNPRYLLDVLSTLGDDQITLLLSDGFSPALLKSANHPEANFVVMPVKV